MCDGCVMVCDVVCGLLLVLVIACGIDDFGSHLTLAVEEQDARDVATIGSEGLVLGLLIIWGVGGTKKRTVVMPAKQKKKKGWWRQRAHPQG